MKLGKTMKVPQDIVKGGTKALKELPAKATGWQEASKIAVTGIAGFPAEWGLEKLNQMILNAIGIEGQSGLMPFLIKWGIKIGVPMGVGTIFIAGKLPFGKLVAVACVSTIVIGIGREVLTKLGFFKGKDKSITVYDANAMKPANDTPNDIWNIDKLLK